MGPISHFSMFHEAWYDQSNDNETFRGRKASELFWRHGTRHQTFTIEGADNRLIEHATVDHVGCCLVSFDSGKRKVAPLNPDTRLLFKEQLIDESYLKPEKIKALSDRGIIVLHGFSELHDAQAFEQHLRVRSYFDKDGVCILDKYPAWPSADQMASYGYVFSDINMQGPDDEICVNMESIWQRKLWTNFAVKNILLNHFSSLRVAPNIFTCHGHL